VLAGWIVIVVAAVMLTSQLGGTPDDSFRLPGAESLVSR
jgi:hypothetical protein